MHNGTFRHGNASDKNGGAILNRGAMDLTLCEFSDNRLLADKDSGLQGATIAIVSDHGVGVSAHLLNVSIDGQAMQGFPQPEAGKKFPSELYLFSPNTTLNITFGKFTHCHDKNVLIDPPNNHGHLYRWVVRGSDVCVDQARHRAYHPRLGRA